MGIRIMKEKKTTDYTFIDDSLSLGPNMQPREANIKRDKTVPDFRLRSDSAKSSSKHEHKSKLSGGQRKQGHSAVYE